MNIINKGSDYLLELDENKEKLKVLKKKIIEIGESL